MDWNRNEQNSVISDCPNYFGNILATDNIRNRFLNSSDVPRDDAMQIPTKAESKVRFIGWSR